MVGNDLEKSALHEFLTYQRASVHAIVAGLDDDALRTTITRR